MSDLLELPTERWTDDIAALYACSHRLRDKIIKKHHYGPNRPTRSLVVEGLPSATSFHIPSFTNPNGFFPDTLQLIAPILNDLRLPLTPNNMIWNYYDIHTNMSLGLTKIRNHGS